MKKNQLTTTQNTNLILGKTKSLMRITKKLLEGKSKELTTHKDITLIGDLMWEKESREMTWYEAMEYAKNLRLGGYDDWRLPTIEELREVVTLCGGINTTYGDDNYDEILDKNIANETYQANYKAKGFASYHYWSSTTNAYTSNYAWFVIFGNGYQRNYYKGHGYDVRCVRAGQISLSQKDNKETSIHQKTFSQFVKKLYDRDEKLGRCFERNVTFEGFEDNKLTWSAEAKGEDKQMLITYWGLINMFVKETFGFETKIVNVNVYKNENMDLLGNKKNDNLTTHKDITLIGDLMWEKESREMNWYEAMEYAKNLRLGGYDDWRLPTIEELGDVVRLCGGELGNEFENIDNEAYQESYKEKGFTSNSYWSSTTHVNYSYAAWPVYFGSGGQLYHRKSGSFYVRCVRAGQ